MKKIIIYIFIVVVFGVSIYLLFNIPRPVTSTSIEEELLDTPHRSDEWKGIFIHGQRVGYSFTKIDEYDTGLHIENRTQMTMNIMNETRTLTTHFFARTDTEYTLKNFALEIATLGHPAKIEGVINGNQLELTSFSGGSSHTQTIVLKEKPYIPDAIREVIKKKDLRPGDEITLPYFDPITQSSATATIKVGDKEKVTVRGREYTGTKVEITFMGIMSLLWLDDNYNLIKESSPAMGLEMIPLSKEEALADIEPHDAFDLIPFFSVKLDKPIPDPIELSYLKLELKNITIEDLDLTDDYQRLVTTNPLVIESFRSDITTLPDITLPITEQSEFLEPSAYIQCRDKEIIDKAHELVGDETDVKKAIGKLVEGVYTLIEKKPTASLPSAIDVLKTREGDCNEHAVLFTALARAYGVPTKIYVGLVNLQGVAYFYHAWCAVWLGAWVPVDPTFNQYPADVGHLKLKEGELSEQAKVLKVVGKLKIDVLDYKKD
jgi:hypothetical protein